MRTIIGMLRRLLIVVAIGYTLMLAVGYGLVCIADNASTALTTVGWIAVAYVVIAGAAGTVVYGWAAFTEATDVTAVTVAILGAMWPVLTVAVVCDYRRRNSTPEER